MDVPDYDLPPSRIAQEPIEPRDAARLLVSLAPGTVAHRRVADLADLLGPGDLLVVNTTKVLPARLALRKRTGGAAEVLLLEPVPGSARTWEALVRPGRRLPEGTTLSHRGSEVVEVGADIGGGRRRVRLLADDEVVLAAGSVPLPPYITAPLADPGRYQTVYADQPGSVAAPTAGLHLTGELLERVRGAGAGVASVDLAVGLGTFAPITAGSVEGHEMHAERWQVAPEVMERARRARRVVAVGTTTVRALESAALAGTAAGRSDLFIRPGHDWQVVDVLLTNFHQPRSSLLVLLEAFVGPRWRELYAEAMGEGYRFLSFGDAMLVGRAGGGDRSPG